MTLITASAVSGTTIGNLITVPAPDADAALNDYTHIRLYKSTTGQFGTYTHLGYLTLVSGTTAYTYTDTAGSVTDWYRYSYYSSSQETQQSDPSPAPSAPVTTLAALTRRVAWRLGCYGLARRTLSNFVGLDPGASGTTTGAGTSTTAVCSAFVGGRWPSDAFKDWFLLATSSTESGNERQITAGLDGTTGTFTTDAFATGVGTAATFELYAELPSGWWAAMVNAAFLDLWTPFRWPLDGISSQTEYPLPYFIEGSRQVERVVYRSGTTLQQHQYDHIAGVTFSVKPLEGGGCYIYLPAGISPNATYFAEGERHPAMLSARTDQIVLSEANQRILVATAAAYAAEQLSLSHSGIDDDRKRWADLRDRLEQVRRGLVADDRQESAAQPIRRSELVGLGARWGGVRVSNTSQYY